MTVISRNVLATIVLALCIVQTRAAGMRPAELILHNPYPATGAIDITGSVPMNRVLRAMQNQVTPSTTDALLRLVRRSLTEGLNVHVEVRRNPRSGGAAVAQSLAGAGDNAVLFAGSGLAASATIDALRTLQPVALLARVPTVLVVAGDAPADIAGWIAWARRRPPPFQVGTAGERSAGTAVLAQLRSQWPAGTLSAVAFNGGNGALRGVLSRQVPAALVPLPALLPYAVDGRIRILAIAAAVRHGALTTVPTFTEAGLAHTGVGGWHGLFAAPALDGRTVAQLQRALRTLEGDAMRTAMLALGYVPELGSPAAVRMVLAMEAGQAGVAARPAQPSPTVMKASVSPRVLPAAAPHGTF